MMFVLGTHAEYDIDIYLFSSQDYTMWSCVLLVLLVALYLSGESVTWHDVMMYTCFGKLV